MTTSSTARVATDRPGRYGKQLASHFSRKLTTEWDSEEDRGHISFKGEVEGRTGEIEMIAGDGVLLLQLEAPEEYIGTLEDIIGRHLVRFGAKDELVCAWTRPGGIAGSTHTNEGED